MKWYHGTDEELSGNLSPLYLTSSKAVAELGGNNVYEFEVSESANWYDIKDAPYGMDSLNSREDIVEKLKDKGYDILWDSEDFNKGQDQIYVINPAIVLKQLNESKINLRKLIKNILNEELEVIFEQNIPKKISFDQAENIFKYFHLSDKLIDSPWAELKPQIPGRPFEDDKGNVIEDNFTPRISIASTIKDAIDAIPRSWRGLKVYAGDLKTSSHDDLNVINLSKQIPDCPKNYGFSFRLKDWIEYILENVEDLSDNEKGTLETLMKTKGERISPKDLPNRFRDAFKGCVPDADETNEYWSTDPIKMLHLGVLENINTIQLSNDAIEYFKRQNINLESKNKQKSSLKEGRFTDYPPSNPEELPHYTPVNPNQSIDDILADVPDSTGNYQSTPSPDPSVQTSQQSQIPQSSRNDGEWGSMDLGNMLMQRVMQQQGQPGLGFNNNGSSTPNMDALQNTQLQPQQEPQMVMVKEGAPSYRKLETKDFGSDMTLVKSMGPLQGIGGKEFETKGEKNCYLADGQDRIDLSEVSPENMLKLVEVHAPFVGAVMVPKEHVMKATSPGPKVLGD